MDLLDIKFCEIFEDVKKIPIGNNPDQIISNF